MPDTLNQEKDSFKNDPEEKGAQFMERFIEVSNLVQKETEKILYGLTHFEIAYWRKNPNALIEKITEALKPKLRH